MTAYKIQFIRVKYEIHLLEITFGFNPTIYLNKLMA